MTINEVGQLDYTVYYEESDVIDMCNSCAY